jgi:hypothetical protein
MQQPHMLHVISSKLTRNNSDRSAPTTFTCHIDGAKSSILNTDEITKVFFCPHGSNLDAGGDICGNPKYSVKMKVSLV